MRGHHRTCFSYISPCVHSSTDRTRQKSGVLHHVRCEIYLKIGNDTLSGWSQQFVKLIHFDCFISLVVINVDSEVVLNRTRSLAGYDILSTYR